MSEETFETQSALDRLSERIEGKLMKAYGPIVGGETLLKVLAFPSAESLRQAVARGTVPVPVFPIEHRRGKFALVSDIARWLAAKRMAAKKTEKNTNKGDACDLA